MEQINFKSYESCRSNVGELLFGEGGGEGRQRWMTPKSTIFVNQFFMTLATPKNVSEKEITDCETVFEAARG